MKMKKTGFYSWVLVLVLFTAASGQAANYNLFARPAEKIPPELQPGANSHVIRQRLVNVRVELLNGQDAAPDLIDLNLFSDLSLTAIRDHMETNSGGGLAWIGYIAGLDESQVTLVVNGQRLSGAITFPGALYQVRFVAGALHLVREIDLSSVPTAANGYALWSMVPAESEVIELVNQERAIEGLHPLSYDNRLFAAARAHSEDMAQRNYFSHTSLDGRTASKRITDAGYSWNTYGENIAAGYATPQAVINGWMNSSGHRANILNSSFCDLGVGYAYYAASQYGHYWTQDFGREEGVSTCPQNETFIISASTGTGGSITPSGSVAVNRGSDRTFVIKANAGYHVKDVIVDGASVGPQKTYTFSNVSAAHSIRATFAENSTVSIDARDRTASESGGDIGKFAVSRTGDLSQPLRVRCKMYGTAENGLDYKSLSRWITIPAGASTKVVRVIPLADTLSEGREAVKIRVLTRDYYNVGTPDRCVIRIEDAQ